jgi:hypothetical protein
MKVGTEVTGIAISINRGRFGRRSVGYILYKKVRT